MGKLGSGFSSDRPDAFVRSPNAGLAKPIEASRRKSRGQSRPETRGQSERGGLRIGLFYDRIHAVCNAPHASERVTRNMKRGKCHRLGASSC